MPESGTYGSVRGAAGNSRPYRECRPARTLPRARGPAFESRQGRKARLGTRISGRYGDLAGGIGAAGTL
jgi:hypothetical protein